MEKMLGVTQARKEFSIIVDRVQHQGDTFIVSRHGRPAAALVPVQVYETWKRQRDEFFELVRVAQGQSELEPEEAARLADEAVAAVRAETPETE